MAQIWIFVQVFKVRAVLSLEPSTGLEKGVFAGCWGFFCASVFCMEKELKKTRKSQLPLVGNCFLDFSVSTF